MGLVAKLPPFADVYQSVSILSCAATALFAAAQPRSRKPVRGLLGPGGYSAFACLDDPDVLHENGLVLGRPERGVMATHAVLLGWLVVKASRLGVQAPWPLLATWLILTSSRLLAVGLGARPATP